MFAVVKLSNYAKELHISISNLLALNNLPFCLFRKDVNSNLTSVMVCFMRKDAALLYFRSSVVLRFVCRLYVVNVASLSLL